MDYGWPYPKRKQFLTEIQIQKTDKTHPVPFQNKNQYFPIYTVPLELPMYRLENGRTMDRQIEYLARHPDLPRNFFRVDLESAEAQRIQHDLLVELAKDNSKNLFTEFKKEKQNEPIILSAQGIVINGNRRLSTWRQLFKDERAEYKHFSTIDVVVLPPCDERDLDRLEATLQIKADLKAEYSWTSRALMYREKRDFHNYTEAEISEEYDIDSQVLNEVLDAFDYANAYLESRGVPERYSELEQKEFAFRQISRTRSKMKQSESYKEVFEKASFCLADVAAEGKRAYAEIKMVGDLIEKISDNLIEELELDAKDDDVERLTTLAEALDEPNNFESARIIIRETLDAEGSKKRQKKKVDYVAEQIRKAREALQAAKESIETGSARNGSVQDLEQIERLVTELREWAKGDGE